MEKGRKSQRFAALTGIDGVRQSFSDTHGSLLLPMRSIRNEVKLIVQMGELDHLRKACRNLFVPAVQGPATMDPRRGS